MASGGARPAERPRKRAGRVTGSPEKNVQVVSAAEIGELPAERLAREEEKVAMAVQAMAWVAGIVAGKAEQAELAAEGAVAARARLWCRG